MREKRQKRVVSKKRYADRLAARALFTGMTALFSLIGGGMLVVSIAMLFEKPVVAPFYALLAFYVFFLARICYKKEREVERVIPVTRRTANLLPPEESLVRASDLSPSHHQAELLRAAPQSKETPAEELLKATNRHD